MESNWISLVVGVFGLIGAYFALKGSWRNSDVDIMKELRETNQELKNTQKENIELRSRISELYDALNEQKKLVKDLKDEVYHLRKDLDKGDQKL